MMVRCCRSYGCCYCSEDEGGVGAFKGLMEE